MEDNQERLQKLQKGIDELNRKLDIVEAKNASTKSVTEYELPDIVGQTHLIGEWNELLANDKFPRFAILTGVEGQGKKTLVRYMFKGYTLIELPDIKVDTIRDMISQAHRNFEKTIYLIPDADTMSVAAKNALLKVTEEPPRQSYFIMTLQDINNTLATIKSRATEYRMDSYTYNELQDYVAGTLQEAKGSELVKLVLEICTNISEVDKIESYDIEDFYDYISLIVDKITDVSCANAFKIGSRVAFKADAEDLYDLKLVWRTFMLICSQRMVNGDTKRYAKGVQITSEYLGKLNSLSVNKSHLFDMWTLDIREAWK